MNIKTLDDVQICLKIKIIIKYYPIENCQALKKKMEDPDENADKQEETDGIKINSLFNYMYSYFNVSYLFKEFITYIYPFCFFFSEALKLMNNYVLFV